MLTFEAVTTFAPRHWDSHARRCVETFREFWDAIPLSAYTDDMLEAKSDWLGEFKRRHADRPVPNYRFDAVRFAHKVAAIDIAYRQGTADVLAWIDADCVTHAPVDAAWLAGLLGDADFGYLRRARKYPECGFMLMRRGPAMDRMLGLMVELYRTDALFGLQEWHDSWAIEQVRQGMGDALRCASLSGDFEHTGHPFVNGPLGARMDHCKGKRKGGRSTAADLKIQRPEGYWRG